MIENKGDLISRASLLRHIGSVDEAKADAEADAELSESMKWLLVQCVEHATDIINAEPAVNAVELPCKIGDFVWAIRSFKGHQHPQRGIVGDMFFTMDMKLMIVVKYVSRGEYGKSVFATYEEAYAAIGKRKEGTGNV